MRRQTLFAIWFVLSVVIVGVMLAREGWPCAAYCAKEELYNAECPPDPCFLTPGMSCSYCTVKDDWKMYKNGADFTAYHIGNRYCGMWEVSGNCRWPLGDKCVNTTPGPDCFEFQNQENC